MSAELLDSLEQEFMVCWCWELNCDPPEEQYIYLTTELFPVPSFLFMWEYKVLYSQG